MKMKTTHHSGGGGAQQKQSLEGNLQQWMQISVRQTKNQSAKLPP